MSAAPVLYVVDGLGLSGKSKAMVDLIAGLDPARYARTWSTSSPRRARSRGGCAAWASSRTRSRAPTG